MSSIAAEVQLKKMDWDGWDISGHATYPVVNRSIHQ